MLLQKAAASRGQCEPGASKRSRKSLRSFISEEYPESFGQRILVRTDGVSPVKGNMYRR